MKKLTKSKIACFAIGQFGWALLSGIIVNWLIYFYQPDVSTMGEGMRLFIPQGRVILGVVTIIGIITAIGRIFDAITDPLIASLSDRSKHKDGRRIPFMKMIALPFALITVLVFLAPFKGAGVGNSIWLFVTIMLYYLCLTIYCTPYTALIPELGKTQEERMTISTYISFTFILGTAVAYVAPMIWGPLEGPLGRVNAMRVTFAGMATLAFICLLVPVFTIREKDYVDSKPSEEGAFKSLTNTFKNRSFRVFVASDISYWVALTMFQTGLPFYITSLMKLDESMTTILFVLMTAVSLLFYIPINIFVKKYGKKNLLLFAFAMFTVTYLITALSGEYLPISPTIQGILIVCVASLPMAIFGILPSAIVADISQSDSIKTGESKEGMFYAARTFAFKVGQGFAMLFFTAVSTIGVAGSGFGYRLTAGGAAIFCLIGGIVLVFYNEKEVSKIIKSNGQSIN